MFEWLLRHKLREGDMATVKIGFHDKFAKGAIVKIIKRHPEYNDVWECSGRGRNGRFATGKVAEESLKRIWG